MLKDQKRWKVTLNEDKDWHIKGKYGVINDCEDGSLDVWITNTRISKAMERAGWKAEHHYIDGAFFLVPFESLDAACRWIKSRKRRVMSQKQLDNLAKARMKSPLFNQSLVS